MCQVYFNDIDEIKKCECPPDSKSYENEDRMLICVSCEGWIQAQNQLSLHCFLCKKD